MRLLRNYVLRELSIPTAAAFGILTFVLILGNLVLMADLLVNRGVSLIFIFRFFIYQIPSLLSYTLPMALLIGLVLSLGRLTADNEIVVMRASGINLYKLVVPIAFVGIVASVAAILLQDRVLPQTRLSSRLLLKEMSAKNPTAFLEEGIFIKAFKRYIVFIQRIDGNRVQNIRIYEPQPNRPTRTIFANRGEFIRSNDASKIRLRLYNGTSDEPDPKDPNGFYKLAFKTYLLTLDLSEVFDKDEIEKKPKEMSFRELLTEAKHFRERAIDPAPLVAEFHKKAAIAFAPLVFVLLGLPVSVLVRRGERSVSFGIALSIAIVYYVLIITSEALAHQGFLEMPLLMWMPNIVMALLGVLLCHRMVRA